MSVEPEPLEFDLWTDDLSAFREHYFFHTQAGRARLMRRRIVWFIVVSAPGLAGVVRGALEFPDSALQRAVASVIVIIAASSALAWFIPAWLIKAESDFFSASDGHWRVTAGRDGLTSVHATGSGLVPWGDFNRVERSGSAVYIYIGERGAVLPAHAFASEEQARAFAEYARERIEKGQRSV